MRHLSLAVSTSTAIATRHCRKTVVLASSQRVAFAGQIQNGEVVELAPRLAKSGTPSMTIEVGLRVENLQTGLRRQCGQGKSVMVAVDADC